MAMVIRMGSPSGIRAAQTEVPPPEEDYLDGEWEDLSEHSERQSSQALVQSLYQAIDVTKKTGLLFRKKQC